jgi:hypothetical protein
MREPGFDPLRRVVLDAPAQALARRAVDSVCTGAHPQVWRPPHGRGIRHLRSAVLVLTDLVYPGWTATPDGAPATIHRARTSTDAPREGAVDLASRWKLSWRERTQMRPRPTSAGTAARAVVAAAIALLVGPAGARAQFVITSPPNGTRLPAVVDFATDVVGDPWDMNNRDDYSRFDPGEVGNLAPLALDGVGHLIGTVAAADNGLTIQHRGFYGAQNPGRNGRRFPIDTARFGLLAFKLYAEVANEGPQVYWFLWPTAHPSDLGAGGRLPSRTTRAGWRIVTVDLAAGNELGPAGTGWTNGPTATAVRIDPTGSDLAVGKQVGLDWVRLVPRDGAGEARTVPIQWAGSAGPNTVTLEELGADASDPYPVASNVIGTSFAFSYGFLPPGTYRLRVTALNGGSDTVDLVVNDPPILHFTEPDETGGRDFATEVLGNPWDMDSAADVSMIGNVVSSSFSGGELHATSPASGAGADSQVVLLSTPTADAPLVDPAIYHRLTFRMRLDGAFDLSPAGGSLARVFWGSIVNRSDQLATSDDVLIWPGDNSYTLDLTTLRVGEDQGLEVPAPGDTAELWTSASKRYFRLDPHEGTSGRTWHVDDVKLADDDQPDADGRFTVKWTWSDADGGAPTVDLYRDDDRDAANGKTLIASGLAAADGQYVWDTTGLPDGYYWLYADISDGTNTTGRYSTGPLKIGDVTTEVCSDCVDNDGNGLTDYEDERCCTATALNINHARFLAGRKGSGYGKLSVNAILAGSQYASADPRKESVTIQFSTKSGPVICTTVPTTAWTRIKKKVPRQIRFRDKSRTLYQGLQQGIMELRSTGIGFKLTSPRMDVSGFTGDLTATVQIGGRCGTATVPLEKRGKRGYTYSKY